MADRRGVHDEPRAIKLYSVAVLVVVVTVFYSFNNANPIISCYYTVNIYILYRLYYDLSVLCTYAEERNELYEYIHMRIHTSYTYIHIFLLSLIDTVTRNGILIFCSITVACKLSCSVTI